jgi:hypothetical protein
MQSGFAMQKGKMPAVSLTPHARGREECFEEKPESQKSRDTVTLSSKFF